MKKVISFILIPILLATLMFGCSAPNQDNPNDGNISDIPGTHDPLPNQPDINDGTEDPDDYKEPDGNEKPEGNEQPDGNETPDGNEKPDNNEKPDEPIREIVDTPYEPAEEGLIGIAFYPLREGESYPYDIGEKVTDMEKWKFLYSLVDYDATVEQRKTVGEFFFDDNVINRHDSFTRSAFKLTGTYKSTASRGYWGYVYQSGEDIHIIATHDAFKPDERYMSDSRNFNVGKLQVKLTCWVVKQEEIPEFYELACVLDNGIRCVSSFKEKELPETISPSLIGEFSHLVVSPFKKSYNGGKDYFIQSNFRTDLIDTAEDGGMIHEYNGFKNNESYQYRITVYPSN